MPLRSGVDLIEIARLETLRPEIRRRFIERVFTPDEIKEAGDSNPSLSAAFAAKEAVSKALGCGIGPISWQEIILHHHPSGEPYLELVGEAARRATELGLSQWSVSLSHSKTHAIAMVVAL